MSAPPPPASAPPAPPAAEPFEIPSRDGLCIRGERYPAAAPVGTVFVCHGFKGFAHWGFFPYLARSLAENGLNAITFDFSGSGIGPDRESFTQPEAFSNNTFTREQEDLDNLVDYARRMKWLKGGGEVRHVRTFARRSNRDHLHSGGRLRGALAGHLGIDITREPVEA